jgi:hypothetical protein
MNMTPAHKLVIILSTHILDGECNKKGQKCKICSIIACPHGSPYHNLKPGCPLCKPGLRFKCLTCDESIVDIQEGIETCATCRKGMK